MTPTSRIVRLCAAWFLLGVFAAIWPLVVQAWWIAGAVLGALTLADLMVALRKPQTSVERQLASSLALGAKSKGVLRLHNHSGSTKWLKVHESHPATFEIEHLPQRIRVRAGGWAQVPYNILPTARGLFTFGPIIYRQASPLGLWWRTARGSDAQQVKVYPNFRAVARYALLATSNRTSELGIRKRQRRGEGTEFHQLREYRMGDSLRQIDWRATSRLMKVVSREYRDERDQQIMFLLDCGRRMHARDGQLSHLDHSLDAVLLLAYVALRQGDAVGLATFGGQNRQVRPRKGASYLNVLLNTVYDLSSTTAASDACTAVESALTTLRRRTLLVLVSNMRDEEDQELTGVLRLASRRHLVLLASLREAILDETLATEPKDFLGALRLAATHDYIKSRGEAHDKLTRQGVLCMDVEPNGLAVSLVNRYLTIKASGEL